PRAGRGAPPQPRGPRNSAPLGPGPGRVELQHAPAPRTDELAVRLPTSGRPGWLYLSKDLSWTKEDQDRIAEALARLIDVALERERLNAQAGEAEGTRGGEVGKTAVLHR